MNPTVHWHEGLFLQPHHLQWMQRQLHESAATRRRLMFPYPYGVIESRLATDALENMLVRFEKLRVVMPSGLEINVPEDTDLPPLDIKAEFEGSPRPFVVELGVPLWYPGRGNTIEVSSGADWRDKRLYKVGEIKRVDENTGENAQPVLVRRINARLLLPGADRTDLETIPVLRVMRATGQNVGKPTADDQFIPPCMLLTGSSELRRLVRDLGDQIEASRKELSLQITGGGFSFDTMRGGQFEQMWRLRTLNKFAGRLPSMVTAPAMTPFAIYLELRELLGELAALRPDNDQFEAAPYDHGNPSLTFRELVQKVRDLLKGVVKGKYITAEFKRVGDIWVAALNDEHLALPNEYFLSVKTAKDPRAVAELVEDKDQFKLMPKSMVYRNVYGVQLKEERHPPQMLPMDVGLHYFRVHRTGPDNEKRWALIKNEKEIALMWPGLESSDFTPLLVMTLP